MMFFSRGSIAFLLRMLSIPLVFAVASNFDCSSIKVGQLEFNFSSVNGNLTIAKNLTTKPSIEEIRYEINPCNPLEKDTSPADEQCTDGTLICRKVVGYRNNTSFVFTVEELAKGAPEINYTKDTTGISELIWKYKGEKIGDKEYLTTITFACSLKNNVPVVESYNSTDLRLTWETPSACPKSSKPSGESSKSGFFSVVGTLLLVGICIYLIGGILFNYFVVGARGLYLIPNLEFWQDFPGNFMALIHRLVTMVSGRRRGGYSSV
ncbi:hypothetical protein DSO57_1019524 [Entomophthora muscae]|uniref:Uncharacterized protein n=1 Tax=Entomophthora muscae TaxID=34485 RepID=A0ACC2UDT0_9FUNG|nr:hypothetical protein DSO57_1019524 [Entomophthora muscae]